MIEQEFRERVRTLVNWGQLPVLALSFVVVFGVSVAYKSQIAGELAAAFAVAGCSLVFSLIASTISFKYEKSATALLYCSLVFSVLYVHFLINLTGSTYSPFGAQCPFCDMGVQVFDWKTRIARSSTGQRRSALPVATITQPVEKKIVCSNWQHHAIERG